MATNQHATTEELLEAAFSVVRTSAVATQRHRKHVSAAMNQHSTVEELLETVFSTVSVPKVLTMEQV
jgi:alkylhydroperoxidase/carboxymuconolactone decarboxylase family protein YurZ